MRIENAPVTSLTLSDIINSTEDTGETSKEDSEPVALTRYDKLKQLLKEKNRQPIV